MPPKQKKQSLHSADSLEDDFAIDTEYVSDQAESHHKPQEEDDNDDGSSPTLPTTASNKRKTTTTTTTTSNKKQNLTTSTAPKEKKPKPVSLWNQYMKKAYPGITQLELEDHLMHPKHTYTIPSPHKEPTYGSPDYLEELTKTAISTGKSKNKVMNGAPQVLIISSSALRVVDLVRRLRPVSTKRPVMKLFSRHLKIQDQKKALADAAVDVAVGTPNRILKLLEEKDLKVNRLRLVVIDCWQDDKMRVVVDMDDTRKDLFAIWRDHLLPMSKNPDFGFKFRLA
ncbi:U3-containing 90S pre-ribosomal complex subunit-domain containing protein [Kickxella alabastrina]|uniref:U3-containing 90S pre-ribosomal complex subunit-domain containing protein n=1 Tax=Kickxella alabastrina TaxID=61397 RepID=UPI00221ED93E|nr:U3-containing 90S pre-ribosomal complex subunit-domain containing protein [Kickxella alabastrina]KAI7827752.1 U3-containing 90S pre-ribosomal complex subunit-domain containing protein [Kickxella alabastrina]